MRTFVKILCGLLVILVSVILYSRYIATTGLVTKEIVIESDALPNSYDGLKVVHITDLHYKRIITENRIDDIVKEINLLNPDIVVFTGDLVDKDAKLTAKDEELLIKKLLGINATYGKYAVIGNHDYMFEREIFHNIYGNSGFILLENTYDIIYNKNLDKIFIGGVDTVSYDKANIDSVMSYFEENEDIDYKIILVHEPDYSDTIVDEYPSVNLILSGHSHNGQVNIPFLKEVFLPAFSRKYYGNHYKVNDTDLYVSSGIGVSRINFRFLNKPSINFYRFKKTG